MKTKFATEKSEYCLLMVDLMNDNLSVAVRDKALDRMKVIEKTIKDQGDELIFIVTTRDTNPMKDKTAPPKPKSAIIECKPLFAPVEKKE